MRFFFFGLLRLVSFDKLDFFVESENYGYGSRSPGKSIGSAGESFDSISGIGFGDFFPTGIESLSNIVPLVLVVPRGAESKGGQLKGSFWHQKP